MKSKLGPDCVAVGGRRKRLCPESQSNRQRTAEAPLTHNRLAFRVGVDGWIYVAMGDFGAMKPPVKTATTLQMHGGGVVRVRLDGSGLEDLLLRPCAHL